MCFRRIRSNMFYILLKIADYKIYFPVNRFSYNEYYCCHEGDEATSIPAQCCAMPYILNGKEFYNCSVNAAESNDLGCYHGDGQSQWVNCQQPQGVLLSVMSEGLYRHLVSHLQLSITKQYALYIFMICTVTCDI